jgi:hypothetical protein
MIEGRAPIDYPDRPERVPDGSAPKGYRVTMTVTARVPVRPPICSCTFTV